MKEFINGMFLSVFLVAIAAFFWGWTSNLIKLAECNFQSPYKCEVFRLGGVVIPPVGGALGYFSNKELFGE